MNINLAVTVIAVSLTAACAGSQDSHRRPELRAALDEAQISLRDSIDAAVATTQSGAPIKAALLLGDNKAFLVGALESAMLKEIRVNIVTGQVISTKSADGSTAGQCPGSIPLTDALGIAGTEANGEPVAVVPDDDVSCAWEIQVLSGDVLWEVKLASDGAVLEKELSDEYSGGSDE